MRFARSRVSLAAAIVGSALLVATPPPASAATARATIVSTPATATVSADGEHVDVRVTYRCRNTRNVRYYLAGEVNQSSGVWEQPDYHQLRYSIGYRGETGIVTARCTGGRVTQTLRYLRYWGNTDRTEALHAGPAFFRFHLDARAATGPGWYQDVDRDALVERTITVL